VSEPKQLTSETTPENGESNASPRTEAEQESASGKIATAKSPGLANLRPPWQKGQSGNPKGKATGPNWQSRMRAAARAAVTHEDIEAIVKLLLGKARDGKAWAIREVLDRVVGRLVEEGASDPAAAGVAQQVIVQIRGGAVDEIVARRLPFLPGARREAGTETGTEAEADGE